MRNLKEIADKVISDRNIDIGTARQQRDFVIDHYMSRLKRDLGDAFVALQDSLNDVLDAVDGDLKWGVVNNNEGDVLYYGYPRIYSSSMVEATGSFTKEEFVVNVTLLKSSALFPMPLMLDDYFYRELDKLNEYFCKEWGVDKVVFDIQ